MTTSTQKWLLENCIKYEEKEKVYGEVDQVLTTLGLYGGSNGWLKVKSDVYTYDDGRTHLLLCLHGLLPINYRNSTYHIPIDIWIPFSYPRSPPIVYVVPTQGMMVKNSKYVDLSGRCDVAAYEDTKGSWLDRGEKGKGGVLGLIEALMTWFGRDPPVYSKAAPSAPASPARPPPPPSLSSHVGPPPPTYSPPPAPIPRPSSVPWTPQPPPIPQHPQQAQYQHTHQPQPHIHHHVPPPPPVTSPTPAIQHQPPPPPVPNLLDSDDSSLPSSVSPAPAPPLPPNPVLLSLHASLHTKFSAALSSLQSSLHLNTEQLRKMQEDLLRGEPAIQDEIARLEAVKAVSLNVGGRLKQSVDSAERNIHLLRDKGDVSVDELICGPTIVHNQLINLIAEDHAIEDTIYHLHRALNAGSIDLDRFLRTTRVLAEEQFMKRALIEKIQAGLPLGQQAVWG